MACGVAAAGSRLDLKTVTPVRLRSAPADRSLQAAHFGRSMEYYTGFVFELRTADGAVELAGGGRYDNLLELLGARQPVTAVGCAIHTERLLAAVKGAP